MVLEVIYIVRHGYRSNWTVDPTTGSYSSSVRTPTGIPSDPALASYGVRQSEQLATHLLALDPPADIIYSSPYYRCLQTLAPFTNQLAEQHGADGVEIWIEPGLGEFYGLADFEHPAPATIDVLREHFDHLHSTSQPIVVPDRIGEGINQLHDRVAYCLDRLIKRSEQAGAKAILVCTHAAAVIAMGRALTGRMPEDVGEEDFQCFTCGVSKFRRRRRREPQAAAEKHAPTTESEDWDPQHPAQIPDIDWRDDKGVAGGWDCEQNSDCSFLENGEERGWNFYMEQQRLEKLREDKEIAEAAESLSVSEDREGKEGTEHNSSGFA